MARQSRKSSPFTLFDNPLGVSEQWEKSWKRFADQATKKMSENMEKLGMPGLTGTGKIPSSPAEWQKTWKKTA
ncbi:MAG: hypothetical protein K2Y18_08410, partial [Alphaproteobacteria bacterium]|nr:hypothetical protein [Alphaproteobacteria bacterium]MBX9805757.1 hypothetical protein [Alphaproteobacteria bacterium]